MGHDHSHTGSLTIELSPHSRIKPWGGGKINHSAHALRGLSRNLRHPTRRRKQHSYPTNHTQLRHTATSLLAGNHTLDSAPEPTHAQHPALSAHSLRELAQTATNGAHTSGTAATPAHDTEPPHGLPSSRYKPRAGHMSEPTPEIKDRTTPQAKEPPVANPL